MTRRRYRSSGRRSYGRHDAGLEAARRHIEESQVLSTKLGGTDKDVKAYFFALGQAQLLPILDDYERLHGKNARKYAEETIPQWRSGRVHMSGLVAARLFDLLPTRMPVSKKFELVKSLWESQCPRSNATFLIGPDAAQEQVCQRVREHLERVVVEYVIPDSIKSRFTWLARDDVELQEKLYNYFLQRNRDVVAEATDHRVPSLLVHLQPGQQSHQRITQTITVGNHQMTLIFDQWASGVTQPSTRTSNYVPRTSRDGTGCLLAIAVLVAAVVCLTVSF